VTSEPATSELTISGKYFLIMKRIYLYISRQSRDHIQRRTCEDVASSAKDRCEHSSAASVAAGKDTFISGLFQQSRRKKK